MSEYLPEDQDLLDELSSIGETSTGTAWNHQQRRLSELQIKSMLRNRKTASDLDKSTSRYSIILIAFAMVQIVVALCQFLFDIETSVHGWVALGVGIFLLIMIFLIFRKIDPDKILKKVKSV